MFSRRTLQTIIDELSEILSEAELNEIVGKMNNPSERLAATWEVAMLHALSQAGTIFYQRPLANGRRPDVTFSLPGNSEVAFIADITVVSDAGYHQENPIDAFLDELVRFVLKSGLNPDHFDFYVGSTDAFGQKIKLRLPKRGAEVSILKKHFLPFLRQIEVDRDTKHELAINGPDLAMTASYDPRQSYMGGGHRVYTQTRSVKHNPLWNRLEAKADQLRNSGGLTRGIIVCDGGCALLSGRPNYEFKSFTVDRNDVVRKFLRTRTSVDFVYAVTLRPGPTFGANCSFQGHLWTRDPATKPLLASVFQSLFNKLPPPIVNADNTARRARQEGYDDGSRAILEFSVGDGITSMRMSARILQEILAGKYSPSEIDEVLGASNGPGLPGGLFKQNPFKTALDRGRLITEISIEPVEGRDDDSVTIKFGPDVAVSPFRAKRRRPDTTG